MSKHPIATQHQIEGRKPHPQSFPHLAFLRRFTSRGVYYRVRCAACGETAYGSTRSKTQAALNESPCLPIEKAWNDYLYHPVMG